MNKTVMWTIIIYTLILIIVGYLYFNSSEKYKEQIDDISTEYKLKYDSLNSDIKTYVLKIEELDSINVDIISQNDSIKNKQDDNEKPPYTPFIGLSPDSVANIFSGYDVSKRYE
jgi:archaellum component FlaF (FlaF/FlaG flagellin family)